jgi:hypothetical protein
MASLNIIVSETQLPTNWKRAVNRTVLWNRQVKWNQTVRFYAVSARGCEHIIVFLCLCLCFCVRFLHAYPSIYKVMLLLLAPACSMNGNYGAYLRDTVHTR